MPARLPDHRNPQQTSGYVLVGLIAFAFIVLLVGVIGRGWRSYGSFALPHSKLAVAEKALRFGDDRAAIPLFRRLAKKGNPTAQYWLAHMTELGLGMARNPAKAIELYKKAAQQNLVAAELRLGDIYLYGNLVPPDATKAKTYLEKAAHRGNAQAAMLLGQIYRVGIGVAANPTKAYAWLEVATLEGNALAKRERDASFRALSLADQKGATTRARQFLKTIKSATALQKSGSAKQQADKTAKPPKGPVSTS
ncbi:MAG: tetratricopeptide repeat protein [Pseudolabrys sp.]